jgi:flagellar basal-body rod modification protein FlgD
MELTNIGAPGSGSSVVSAGGGQFSENEFLRVLVTQMQNQTPLDPVDNGQFLDQMASFSSMQEQRELNQNMLELLNFQGLLARLQGLSEGSTLLGKEITYALPTGEEKSGIAESVFVNNEGEVRVVVSGEEISSQQIVGVSQPSSTS